MRITAVLAVALITAACTPSGSLRENRNATREGSPPEPRTCSATGKFVGSEVIRDLYTKRVATGMTPCEVVAAWGEPVDVDIMNSRMTVYRFRDGSRYAIAWFLNDRLDSVHPGSSSPTFDPPKGVRG